MIKSCVTISLVAEARGGPFVFWDDLEAGCRAAAELGYDAVEVFAPSNTAIDEPAFSTLLGSLGLKLAAVGTGAGWVLHRRQLSAAEPAQREEAKDFIRSIIDMGAPFGAPAIIGSMQGRWGDGVDKPTALGWLAEALDQLGAYAAERQVPLIYEPLNRYETNLVNTVADGVALLESINSHNVKLLADLFHMNIEESDLPEAIRAGGKHIGHVHFVDSNRQPAGRGHMNFAPIAEALGRIQFDGYVSAEAFAIPDSMEAARLTMSAYRQYFG